MIVNREMRRKWNLNFVFLFFFFFFWIEERIKREREIPIGDLSLLGGEVINNALDTFEN